MHDCSYLWLDEDTLVAFTVPDSLGPLPDRPQVPFGPVVQDNSVGEQSQTRTYQDLLKVRLVRPSEKLVALDVSVVHGKYWECVVSKGQHHQ